MDGPAPKSLIDVRVQSGTFDAVTETARLTQGRTDIGAVVTFTGICRDEGGLLNALEIEHYPEMAEAEIRRVVEAAGSRWPLAGGVVVHRFGRICPGEPIVLVLTASRNREAAFEAARFIMDFLKTEAPFWKKQDLCNNEAESWVDAKETDAHAARRWTIPKAADASPPVALEVTTSPNGTGKNHFLPFPGGAQGLTS